MFRNHAPVFAVPMNANKRALPIHQHRRGPEHRTVPDTLSFYFGIEGEGGAARFRQAQVDQVAELVARKA